MAREEFDESLYRRPTVENAKDGEEDKKEETPAPDGAGGDEEKDVAKTRSAWDDDAEDEPGSRRRFMPDDDEPPFLGYGEEVHYDECVACSGTCVGDCGCPASCGCSCCDHGICPVHSVPYEECESLHPSDYEDAATNAVATLAGVLYIRDPPVVGDQVYLEVPSNTAAAAPTTGRTTWASRTGRNASV